MQVTMKLEKETKGALRYTEVDSPATGNVLPFGEAKIGTLYVRKSSDLKAQHITVTVEVID